MTHCRHYIPRPAKLSEQSMTTLYSNCLVNRSRDAITFPTAGVDTEGDDMMHMVSLYRGLYYDVL